MVVGTIEKSLHFKKYILAAFVDIEVVFINFESTAIKNELQVLKTGGLDDQMDRWL